MDNQVNPDRGLRWRCTQATIVADINLRQALSFSAKFSELIILFECVENGRVF